MDTIIPLLIVGPFVISLGILITIFRHSIYRATASNQRFIVGRRIARQMERRQSPFWVGFVGIFAVLMGLFMITGAVVGLATGVR